MEVHMAAAMTVLECVRAILDLAWQALLLLCDPMVLSALQLILLLHISLPQSRHITRGAAPTGRAA